MAQPPGRVPVGSAAGAPVGPGRPSVQDTGTTTGWDGLAGTLSGLARDGESGPVSPLRAHSTDGSAAGVWSLAPSTAQGRGRAEVLPQRCRPER